MVNFSEKKLESFCSLLFKNHLFFGDFNYYDNKPDSKQTDSKTEQSVVVSSYAQGHLNGEQGQITLFD